MKNYEISIYENHYSDHNIIDIININVNSEYELFQKFRDHLDKNHSGDFYFPETLDDINFFICDKENYNIDYRGHLIFTEENGFDINFDYMLGVDVKKIFKQKV